MDKFMKYVLTTLAGLALLSGIPADAVSAAPVVDQAGRLVQVPEAPQRVIALAPSLAEIVFSLGQESKLKGVTQYSDFPPAARLLPRVGSYVRLDLERIVALKPDLCLAIRDGNPKHTVDAIVALGIPVYVIDPRNLNDTADAILRIGRVLGAEARAAALVADMRRRIERVRQKAAQAASRPAVFFQVDGAPIISAGSNTFTHELITLAGGRNLAAGSTPYPRFGWEDILTMRPEIVVVTSMAGGQSPDELRREWRRWRDLPAVRHQRVHVVEAGLFDRPTARLVQGLEVLADIIHPGLLGESGAQ